MSTGTPFLCKTRDRASVSQPERVPARPQCSGTRCPQVKQRLLPVEFPLLGEELAAADDRLASAEHTLFWHHEGTNPPSASQGHRPTPCVAARRSPEPSRRNTDPAPRVVRRGRAAPPPRGAVPKCPCATRCMEPLAQLSAWLCVFLPGVMEYIQETRGILYDLQTRVQKAKLNVEHITQLMEVAFAGAV